MSYEIRDYKLVIFDKDGTLTEPKSGERFPRDARDWKWMDGRGEKIIQLRDQNVAVAIATNQAAPLWRKATGQDRYPSVKTVTEALLSQLIVFMQITKRNTHWYVSLFDQKAADLIRQKGLSAENILDQIQDEMLNEIKHFNLHVGTDISWRKPNPGMLLAAMGAHGVHRLDTLYVGDREEDRLAAEAAGCDFEWAWEYFGEGPIIV